MKIKSIRTILLTLAALAAGTSATRADHLSDLVAAVAASMDSLRMDKDVMTPLIDTRPRYQSRGKAQEIEVSMLEGIYRSMKRQSAERMMLRRMDDVPFDFEQPLRPTLGRSDFFRPVPGIITSRFGWRPQFQRMHHGVDLALNIGDTVRAAVNGEVERIGYDACGYGHYVVLSHADGMETLYGHLQYPLTVRGQYVFAGQAVGIGGNTGNSTGPHLHFETRLDGIAIDPTLIFNFHGSLIYYAEEPKKAASTTPVYSHQSKSLRKESTYIVRYGDTPESVARQAGISVMRLCQLNLIKQSDPLTVGRMLKLK